MNIVCLSNLRDAPGYVIQRVAQEVPGTRIVQVNHVRQPSPFLRKLKSALKGAWVRRVEHSLYYRAYFEHGSRELERMLESSRIPVVPIPAQIRSIDVNGPATVALLESLRPDLLLVAGAPILRPHIFGIPRLAAINVHFGISPGYRGEHTLFWPMYYRDYANVGVTIHLIDKGIDSGPILAHGFLEVSEDDEEWWLEAKAARMAADLLIEVLRDGRFQPRWQPQPAVRGRLFRFHDRRLWHDAWLATRRWRSSAGSVVTRSHTVNYCRDPLPREHGGSFSAMAPEPREAAPVPDGIAAHGSRTNPL